MKRFKQFLEEGMAGNRIHHNVTPSHFKSLLWHFPDSQGRFVIDPHNKLHVGAAHHYVHSHLYPNENEHPWNDPKSIHGYAHIHPHTAKVLFTAHTADGYGRIPANHPTIQAMKKHFIHSKKQLGFEW